MIELIIFDLDGVLVRAKEMHFNALNEALESVDPKFSISYSEHLNIYDGLKTKDKLNILTEKKGLPKSEHENVWLEKQKITAQKINEIGKDSNLVKLFEFLSNHNLKIACCSNSIRSSLEGVLQKLGLIDFFDYILSNEDVSKSKPHPEMYWQTMIEFGKLSEQTLIVEDSPHGLLAAQRSGANILRVKDPSDLTIQKVKSKLNIKKELMNTRWQDNNLNVLIPMAGAGSRFQAAGYTFPKPLIEVRGKPMIQVVVENLNCESPHTFIVQKEHRKEYNLDTLLNLITPKCNVIEVDGMTEGAACTTLLSKEIINTDQPLLIANSDQYVQWDTSEFLYKMQEQDADAGILTFKSTHPKWSFAKVNDEGDVTEVAEKKPISDIATVGIYYWKKGSDYVKYAEQMIEKNIRHNNEFYVCPVFNEAIQDGKKVKTFDIENMWGLGTPEDLDFFLKNN
jgi:HAD superfamily hydrolase (TIGR01509 family)|tara:strand:- start:564 stop:1922 length:1359 start_codon:yes stop_codon:yes gene_type:complete